MTGLARREYARDELGRFATRARQALARHPSPGPAPPLPPGALRPGAAADLGMAAALAAHHEHAQAYHRHVAAHNVYRALAGAAPPPVPPRPDLPPKRQARLFHKAAERYGEEEFLAGRVHGPYAAAVHADDPGLLDVAKGAAAGRHAAALAQAAAHARSLAAALPDPAHRPMQAADLSAGHLIDAGAVHEGLRPAVEGLAAKLPHAEHESGLRLALPSTPEASATLRALTELGAASRLKDDPDARREVLERLGPEGVKKLRGGGLSTLEVRHAPAGGAAAKGKQYKGGQFEPSEAAAAAEGPTLPAVAAGHWLQPPVAGTSAPADAQEAVRDWKENGVRSKAFKAWFGDWENDADNASKIVTEDGKPSEQIAHDGRGKPIVFHHGTNREFNEFRDGWAFFAPSESYAENYTFKGKLLHCYLNIRKPIDLRSLPGSGDVNPEDVRSALAEHSIEVELSDLGEGEIHQVLEPVREAIRDQALEKGYDGLIQNENFDGQESESVVAFKPEQIKSADNRGTFDPQSPNFLLSLDPDHPSPPRGT